jgi:hypothetical protein
MPILNMKEVSALILYNNNKHREQAPTSGLLTPRKEIDLLVG